MSVYIFTEGEDNTPFAMNISNMNFKTLWSSLGLDLSESFYGEIDPKVLKEAVNKTPYELIVRADQHDGNYHCFGIDEARAKTYLKALNLIAERAIEQDKMVIFT